MVVTDINLDKIREFRSKKMNSFKEDQELLISEFKNENATIQGYNGRQVLELFQNCDDQNSENVLIEIDTVNNTFTISNTGEPFSENGYKSLFYTNNSPKTSGKFIGNKGLGFRSIISWASSIEIHSNDICLEYAHKHIEKAFEENFSTEERDRILKEKDLRENVIPLPFLSYPEIKESTLNSNFSTSVVLKYKKEFEQHIIDQVNNITEETLLFLNSIRSIEFVGFNGKSDIIVTEKEELEETANTKYPIQKISIGDKRWYIAKEEEQLSTEFEDEVSAAVQKYQLKIAYQNGFKDCKNRLFSFFLTEEEMCFPFLIHGTFELDQNRKQISNDSKGKNYFILQNLAKHILKVACSFTETEVSWKALKFLNYRKNGKELFEDFYSKLEELIDENMLVPCIDGKYRCIGDAVNYGNSFAKMIQTIGLEQFFPNHIIPYDEDISIIDSISKRIPINIREIVSAISHTDLSNPQRAKFIAEIVKLHENKPNVMFEFLTNTDKKLIKPNEFIYTPVGSGRKLEVPKFADIQFLNTELYELLAIEFNYQPDEKRGKSRFIFDMLMKNANIHSYEPATLAIKIISETNNKLKSSSNGKQYIQEMNQCLFHNYLSLSDVSDLKEDLSIPILTKTGSVANTKDTYLSEYYSSGKDTELIFSGIYNNNSFIASPEDLGFDTQNEDFDMASVESYLEWILVNKFARYQMVDKETDHENKSYLNYALKQGDVGEYRDYEMDYTTIDNFSSIIKSLSPEKLIYWMSVDNRLRAQLSSDHHGTKFRIREKKKKQVNKWVEPNQSPLKHAILSMNKFKFENYVIGEKNSWINDIRLDIDDSILSRLNENQIDGLLKILNAKDDFNQLSIEHVSGLFDKLNRTRPDGSGSQTFYKKALNHYKKNKQPLCKEIQLFARNSSGLKLLNQDQIYFSESVKLPDVLIDSYPIFNYPMRAGGELAIKFFGINDLKNVNTQFSNKTVNQKLTRLFNEEFNKLKPFILSYRLENLVQYETKKIEANRLNNTVIELCDSIECKVDTTPYKLANNHYMYIKAENKYAVKIQCSSVSELLKQPTFSDCFADILGDIFNTTGEKENFSRIIREDIEYNTYLVDQRLGINTLNEAQDLLGKSNDKLLFWESIIRLLNQEKSLESIRSKFEINQFIEKLKEEEYIIPSINYSNLHSFDNVSLLSELFRDLSIELTDFNNIGLIYINLSSYHQKGITSYFNDQLAIVKSALWSQYNSKASESQVSFLNDINAYMAFNEYVERVSEENKYVFELSFDAIFDSYVESILPELNLDNIEIIDIELKREENASLFELNEKDLITKSEEFRSLLYFKSSVSYLKDQLNKENSTDTSESIENADIDIDSISIRSIKEFDIESEKQIANINGSGKKIFTGDIDNSGKKRKGDSAEKIVYKKLVSRYGAENVDFTSKTNEGMHYDIKYKNDYGVYIYVEVKSFQGNNFIMSSHEKAFSENNKENYEIWLVRDNDIIVIDDFEKSNKYTLSPVKYKVHLILSE